MNREGQVLEHLRSGDLYRFLFRAWSVEHQCQAAVYVSLKTGEVFTRKLDSFELNFSKADDVQSKIQPREHPFPTPRP